MTAGRLDAPPFRETRRQPMSALPCTTLREVFAATAEDSAAQEEIGFRVLRRGGDPFLFLPTDPHLGVAALDLYPAQSAKARLAKGLLRVALRLGAPTGVERCALRFGRGGAFVQFLARTAKLPAGELPRLAVLAGNPRTEGRRFVMLVFGADDEPAAVVKAGTGDAARKLIAHETNFLQRIAARTPGVPVLCGTFASGVLDAFALDYFAGHPPRAQATPALAELLGAWVSVGRVVTVRELPAWQRLLAASARAPLPPVVAAQGGRQCHAVLAHGDFAPWNVKVAQGRWTVLDWERGEPEGMPAWDWFHFLIQPMVLVRRDSVPALMARVERLIVSDSFSRYARQTGVLGLEREWVLAYLGYCARVIRQADGLDRIEALERALIARWFPSGGRA